YGKAFCIVVQNLASDNPDTRTNATIFLQTVCLTLATATLFIRLYTRFFIAHVLGGDDCKTKQLLKE
ncbi:MAG: hypothetical protein Q9202_006152, partial [Teloschistes flavicans]